MTQRPSPETPADTPASTEELAVRARRRFLQGVAQVGVAGAAAATTAGAAQAAWGGATLQDALGSFFQDQYQRMTPDEIAAALARIERKAPRQHGVAISCANTPPNPNTVFGYALNISKCKGYRDCVEACLKENNQGRDSQVQYIRVLELDNGTMDLERSNHYYDPKTVPQPGDWCIGCRYCMTACPYWARNFNWTKPHLHAAEVNPKTHYLGNRPRPQGVVEKCHFCTQRTRKGRQPACQEACPTGARVFGNLLDANSEIRWILANKQVFRLKEELGTEPKFWYYSDDKGSAAR